MKVNDDEPIRKAFSSGAVRGTDADGERYDLISPIGLKRIAETYAYGAKKYTPFNWEKGIPASNMLNHALRHLYMFLAGDTNEDHLAHAAWNVIGAMHSQTAWPHLNKELNEALEQRRQSLETAGENVTAGQL